MAKSKTLVCNLCFEDITYATAYKVSRHMHRAAPEMGEYFTYYCKECTTSTDTYKNIIQEPKKPRKKKK
jgi:hypothetical protein